jgi:hypothetical protein
MTRVVILLSGIIFVAAVLVFTQTMPQFDSWPNEPWREVMADRTWVMLLVSALLFIVFAVLLTRGGSPSLWFVAFATSVLPIVASLLPCAYHLHTANEWWHSPDAGGDVWLQNASVKHVYFLGLALSALLATMAAYGFVLRRRRS